MILQKKPIQDLLFSKKLEKFTYNLLYPAFYGNMIYDLIQAKTHEGKLVGLEVWIGLVIIIFNTIDYIHLFTDVEDLATRAGGKDEIYIICDIATSILFFISFVFLKYQEIEVSFLVFSVIPIAIGLYKQLYFFSPLDKKIFKWVTIFSLPITLVLVLFGFQKDNLLKVFLGLSSIELFSYCYYVFKFIPDTLTPHK